MVLQLSARRAASLLLALGASLAVALLAPSGKAGPAAQAKGAGGIARTEALDRLKRVALAFWHYYDDHGEFPPSALRSKDGKALLSWRVLLLPYLGEAKLFREFKLAEPWDSPHNKKLLARMPKDFEPVRGAAKDSHATPWQVFTGPGTLFEASRACRIQDITDGTSNTLLVVEAARPVPWTKPEDLPYDPKRPLPKLGSMFPGEFLFALADGSVNRGRRDFPERTMRLLITRNDGMVLNLDGFLVEE
jgi:hypothetical protein